MTNNNKYSTEEGLKELTRSLLMMKYDNSKTLNEQLTLLGGPGMFAGQIAMTQKVGELVKKGTNYAWGCSVGLAIRDTTKVSECLTELRDAMWTDAGIVMTTMIEILGSEVGAPIIVRAFNYLFLINDTLNTIKNWKSEGELFESNPNIRRVIEDLLFISLDIFGAALIKGALKTPAGLLAKVMEYTGKKTEKDALIFLAKKVETMFSKTGNLGIFKEFFEKNKNEVNKLINLIEKTLDGDLKFIKSSISGNVKKSIKGGAITYVTLEGIKYSIGGIMSAYQNLKDTLLSNENKPSYVLYSTQEAKEVIFAIEYPKISFSDDNGQCYIKKGKNFYSDEKCEGKVNKENKIDSDEMKIYLFKTLLGFLQKNGQYLNDKITSWKVFTDTKGEYSTHLNSVILQLNGYPNIILCPTKEIKDSNFGKQYCKPYFDDKELEFTSRYRIIPASNIGGNDKNQLSIPQQTDNTKTQLNPVQSSATQKMENDINFFKKIGSIALSKGWGPLNNEILKNLYDNGYLFPESPNKNKLSPEEQKYAQEPNKNKTINKLLFNKN